MSCLDEEELNNIDEQAAREAETFRRLRAALRLLGNEDITPAGRRVLERVLDAEEEP